jgi:hypothetical protein
LLKTVKWLVIPVGLLVLGYFVVGPLVSDYANESRLIEKVENAR